MAKLISAIEAVMLMEGYKGHGFVHVQTKTEPKFIGYKRDASVLPAFVAATGCNHPTEVVKFSEYNAQLGLDYTSVIERRLLKQGKDTTEYTKGESWHVPYNDTKTLRKHKDNDELYFYLFLTAQTKTETRFVDTKKGTEISRDLIKPFLAKESAPSNQGLEEGTEVQVRTLKLESLVSIKLDGEEYIVR